jgi:transposase
VRSLRRADRRPWLRQQRHTRCRPDPWRRGRHPLNPQPQDAIPYNHDAYRTRNLVERLWCRLKDWRRIATRYDKLAANYMAGVFLAAAITFWC